MRAYRGTIKNGVVILEEGVNLPEGAIVTVTIGETEILRATLRNALQPKERKVKVKLRPMPTP
jgi:predicted DNA-binding antitoxin AbrB/MazE fold protein